jgi:hypothetical protein
MGVYLNQLPPPEIARLKAELAETIIANFCYPRFFDYRTNSLRMRPVDRAKRQEVWLFLSSVDFATWGRVDLTSPDLQKQIERLFIQFVQRNRSFFGEQGRKRMPDIRMLITSSAASVAQGLRNHLSGQRGAVPFGSPRPATTWSSAGVSGKAEPSWEQIAASTMLLQQQLQEVRGEMKPALPEGRAVQPAQRRAAAAPLANPSIPASRTDVPGKTNQEVAEKSGSVPPSTGGALLADGAPNKPAPAMPQRPAASIPPVGTSPASSSISSTRRGEMPPIPGSQPGKTAQSGPLTSPSPTSPSSGVAAQRVSMPPQAAPTESAVPRGRLGQAGTLPGDATAPTLPTQRTEQGQQNISMAPVAPPAPSAPMRSAASPAAAPPALASSLTPGLPTTRESGMMRVGEDDLAIFEEMRTQLIVWLRIEAVRAGADISGKTPPQLLELLRQLGALDETRLQVVSTLLNLANQVLKNGQVSVLDYKQALMFHLMHTRYWK